VGPFFDFVGADSFAFSAKGGSQKFGRQVGLIMFPTTKSNSGRSIATHPCKKRKGGAPSVGMVHAKMVKGGPPAPNADFKVEQTFTVRYGGNDYNLTTKFLHETQIVNGTATNTVTPISP
jgi:hypothetical protein